MKNEPCKGCPVRYIGCHGICPKYITWKEKYLELQQTMKNYYKTNFAQHLNSWNKFQR